MTTSPTFTGYSKGTYSNGTFTETSLVGQTSSSITYPDNSVSPGTTVTWNYGNNFSYTTVYQGYYVSNGIEYPVIYYTDVNQYELLGIAAQGTYSIAASAYVACYAAGTLIRTSNGDVAVQQLVIGDRVVTTSGQERPIKWLGRRSYAGRFLAANPKMQPVRFCAGSLGDGKPHRDLMVSPEHAMFLDSLLVPARYLVNGISILHERNLPHVEYFHIELESHDVILAEGAASETFIDDDSRGMFQNAGEFAALYPDASEPTGYCAPRIDGGYELEAIRQRLAGLAGEMRDSA